MWRLITYPTPSSRHFTNSVPCALPRQTNVFTGETLNYKIAQNGCYGWLLTVISWTPLVSWGLVLAMFLLYLRLPSLLVVMTIFGKSRDLKTKTPSGSLHLFFFRWNKSQKGECIPMQKLTHGLFEIYLIEKATTSKNFMTSLLFTTKAMSISYEALLGGVWIIHHNPE